MFGFLFFCAIQLSGVTGDDLRARAFFDANNVKVGDPLVLTVDFVGEADFRALHPPALSRAVDRRVWRVDDVSAKTDTFRDARRLTYRVRPLREGVIWFPALSFDYADATGGVRTVRANAIPVHAKAGKGVVVDEMDAYAESGLPRPPELVSDPKAFGGGVSLSDDRLFAWKKACAKPTADAFAAFDFPAAKMNEATCAIREGNWARATKLYQRLEWRIGQTPEIERGLVSALALRYENPAAELPVWRKVGRPVLKFAWLGRVSIVAGTLVGLALLFWLLGRGIRAVACLALALLPLLPASGQDMFRQMEEQMRRMRQQMDQAFGGGFGMSFGGTPVDVPEVTFKAAVSVDKKDVSVGESFGFLLSLERTKDVSLDSVRIAPSEPFGLRFTGSCENLPDEPSPNPTNVISRFRVPVRYDVPFKGPLSFTLVVPYTRRIASNRRGFSFSSVISRESQVTTPSVMLDVKPPTGVGQPADYAGLVSEGLFLHAYPDILKVETNDVVKIVYRLQPRNGFVPKHFLPRDCAFEAGRAVDRSGEVTSVEYVRYFIADGAAATPPLSVSYFDPRTKAYRRAEAPGAPLKYYTAAKEESHVQAH